MSTNAPTEIPDTPKGIKPLDPPRVIGLTGPFGAGKDTAGMVLSDLGYRRLALADLIRADIVAFVLDGCEFADFARTLIVPPDIKSTLQFLSPLSVYLKPTPPAIRRLLQWWGTEYGRGMDPDHWLRWVAKEIATYPMDKFYVSDIRFRNEAEKLVLGNHGLMLGITSKRISPDVSDLRAHASETEPVPVHKWIDNNGTVTQLRREVIEAVNAWMSGDIDIFFWRWRSMRRNAV